jgi:YD repeat-containing protein
VRASLSGSRLTLSVDPAWLADPARVFPVTIDPTINPNPSPDCTLSNGGSANTSFCAATTLDVGYDGTTTSRSVAKFDLSSIPTNATVDNAELKLYLASESTTASAAVNAYPLSRAFTSSATWNKYDGTNSWTAAGGDFATTPTVATTAGGTLGSLSWFPTTTVTQWLNGTLTNNGFLLKQASEGSTTNVLHFSSSESSTNKPQLVVVWHYSVGDGRQYTMISQKIDDRLALNVNVANGNLMLQAQDLHLPGINGLDMNIGRTFNSMSATTWFLSSGWQLNMAPMVFMKAYGDGTIRYVDPSGQELLFTPTTLVGTTQNYSASTGVDATLTKNTTAGTFTLIYNQSGIKLSFSNALILLSMADRNGNTITVNWSGGYVTGFTDTHGQTTSVTYDSTHTVITDISFPSGRSVHYAYDSDFDFMTSSTDSNGKVTTFTPDPTTEALNMITDPVGNQTKITYYTFGWYHSVHTITRVTNTGAGTGPTWTFTYNSGNTVVQDPNGKNWTYRFDKQDRVTEVDDPLSRSTLTDYSVYSGCPTGEQGSGLDDSNGGGSTGDNGAVGNACFDANNNPTRTLDPGNANGHRALALSTYADPNNIYAPNTTNDANGDTWNYA